ncbi:MAG: hypothetical protein COB15_16555 [Flavobacteriales bacterium]|nr:MAG: hypothetical protein COB15_16555 [Flavobacteriales bacterium]
MCICLNLYGLKIIAQTDSTLSNAIYATVYGVKNDKPLVDNIDFRIKSEGENYIEIEKFIEPNSTNVFRDVYNIWALRYKNEYYVHLATSFSDGGLKQFVKINKDHLSKNYLLFVINSESLIAQRSIGKEFLAIYTLGTIGTGILLQNNSKALNSSQLWLSEKNEKNYIYYIDLKKSLNPKIELLSPRKLKKFYRKDKELVQRINDKEVLFEEAVELLERLNN